VRYRKDRDRADLLVVSLAVHDVDGTPTYVRRSEFVLIAAAETMTPDGMRTRVKAEAARRVIGRVAWIEEI
jgi:hypothetical protein